MSSRPEAIGIVVAHGNMAQGLVDAVRRIAGSAADGLVAVSNEARTPQELVADLEAAAGGGPALVFVDLQTGSCGMAALVSCRESVERRVICGVNLPMLLHFVFNRSEPFDDLLPSLVEKGREAIKPAPSGG